ncbi:MAG: MarR family transcriptional regulator [Actinomycetota bacterium]|nr:MarR family transcriptional regulator [Actinomycetota bacterium]
MGTPLEQVEEELTLLVCRAQPVHLHNEGGDLRLLERSAYNVLGRAHDEGVVRLSELAATFMLDTSTVSRQVAALQATGLIRRDPDPSDRRAALLKVTPTGRDVLERTRAQRRRILHDVLATWPIRDVELFAGLLARFNADLREHAAATISVLAPR